MNDDRETASGIDDRLRFVRGRIEAACERSGRRPEEVTLIAVSKTRPFSDVMDAWEAGVVHFGENYVQEMTRKMELAENGGKAGSVQWHMIGHLQKNKVKYLIGRTALIHSVDSVSLAEQIEKEAEKRDQTVRILLEVNVAREESKWGFDLTSVFQAAREISALPRVRVLGLMTSAPCTEEPETNRLFFRQLNACARELAAAGLLASSDPDFHVPVLSMGMSGDYEVAVEEGATMVRVGTLIFGKRDVPAHQVSLEAPCGR